MYNKSLIIFKKYKKQNMVRKIELVTVVSVVYIFRITYIQLYSLK